MKMVTGLIERTYGEILFNGAPIEADLIAYKRRMGYVPEEPYLYNHLSAAEYLVMVAQLHRVILVFFLALAFACALSLVRQASAIGATAILSFDFVILTTCMMMFTVLGFRAVFPILISLNANWVLRLTHLRPSRDTSSPFAEHCSPSLSYQFWPLHFCSPFHIGHSRRRVYSWQS